MRIRRPSAATIIAVVALFFALGGSAVASHFLITSTSEIKPSVLKKLKGNQGPVGPAGVQGATGATGPPGPPGRDASPGKEGPRGPEGKEGKEGKEGPSGGPIGPEGKEGKEGKEGPQGPEGKEGPQGQEGKEGKEGPPAKLSALETVHGAPVEIHTGEEVVSVAFCPPGKRPVSGGFSKDGPAFVSEFSEAFVSEVAPGEFESGWLYGGRNASEAPAKAEAIAYCAGEGEAVKASPISAATRQRVKAALLAQIQARHRRKAHARALHTARHP